MTGVPPTAGSDANATYDADARAFGISERGPGQFAVTLERRLCRPDAMMYGGHAAAMAAVAFERASGRQLVWSTSQFLASAPADSTVTIQVDEVVRGRRSSQLSLTTIDGAGAVVFTAMGATVDPDALAGGLVGQFAVMPTVPAPESCRRLFPTDIVGELGWHSTLDIRLASAAAEEDPSRICFWIRHGDGVAMTTARIAYAVDMVPMAVARATGVFRGRSLDNTLRIIRPVPSQWVLADFRPKAVWGGYGAGEVLVWSPDGTLMALESQSTFVFAGGRDPLG